VGRVAVIGEGHRAQGWVLGGALVLPAVGPEAVRSAWAALPGDVEVVILTQAAAVALGEVPERARRLRVVMPG